MKKRVLLSILVASLMVLLSACGKDVEVSKQTKRTEGTAVTFSEPLVLLASGSEMELYLEPSTTTLRWQNKATGEYKSTRIFDSQVSSSVLKNDLIFNYFTGKATSPYSKSDSMDTQKYGVEMETVSYEALDNGVRVIYHLGNDKKTYRDFPTKMSDERMQECIISHIGEDKKLMKKLKNNYRYFENDGFWLRLTNEEHPLAGLSADELYELFYVTCGYTVEDLEADDAEWDCLDDLPSVQKIVFALDYVLDGNDLVVHMNCQEIEYNEKYPLKSINFLPFFLSSKSDDGYLFVPDGSGAIIRLDNVRDKEYQFNSRYWGGDVLKNAMDYDTTKSDMLVPVYGIKEEDHAILGIIEEGAEVATLNAYIKNSFNSVPYSRVSLTFAIREDQVLNKLTGAVTNFTLAKSSTDYYAGNITVRYRYLTGDNANYSGMAQSYRDYLLERNEIAVNPAEKEAPLFLEVDGAVDTTKYFLGIPYTGLLKLTDFKQTTQILSELSAAGVNNIKVDYVGIGNKGVTQRNAEKVEIIGDLGGKSGLKKLNKYAQSIGCEIYPDFRLQTVYTDKGLSKDELAFAISGSLGQIYEFSIISRTANKKAKYPEYLINPAYISEYISHFSKSYKKLGIETLASNDFYNFITPNYRSMENMSITSAMTYFEASLKELDNNYKLMLSKPISKSWGNVYYITNLNETGSDIRIIDDYVPFVQMVLSGNITYSTDVLNHDSYEMKHELMKAMEYGSALKFRTIGVDTSELYGTEVDTFFLSEYEDVKDIIIAFYKEYEQFYQKVSGAHLVSHEYLENDGSVVMTKWSNGVTAVFNYSEETITAGNITVPANSYTVK